MTTTETTTYPYCVTITRPGHGTRYLGFTTAHGGEMARARLTAEMQTTTHVPGTVIGIIPTPDDVTPEPPLTTDVYALADEIRQENCEGDTGARFPDLYNRLSAQEGYERAAKLWRHACVILDTEEDEEEDDEPDSRPLEDQSREAMAALGRLWQSINAATDGGGIPAATASAVLRDLADMTRLPWDIAESLTGGPVETLSAGAGNARRAFMRAVDDPALHRMLELESEMGLAAPEPQLLKLPRPGDVSSSDHPEQEN